MYTILIIIITIIIVEIYSFLNKNTSGNLIEEPKTSVFSIDKINPSENPKDNELFNQYSVKSDKKIKHGPGKIMILDDYNIFINMKNYNFMMKKNNIYNIYTEFEIEILNVSDENIIYYYINN